MDTAKLAPRIRRCAWAVVFALLGLPAGCTQGDRPELGTVTGVITLDGQPLKNVEIAFVPPDGRASYGETDEEGFYELIYIRDIKGAKVGKHKLLVRSGRVDNDKLQEVEVKAGKNTIDIECVARPKGVPQPKGDDAEA